MLNLESIDVFILCGGLGKRLRSEVSEVPKVLAEINGQPFLDILLDYLAYQGFKRFILGVGYKSDAIIEHYRSKKTSPTIEFSTETEPLGTGGAIKHAKPFIKSDPFFALNGDCFCPIDFRKILEFYFQKKAKACLVVSEVRDKQDFGSIALGPIDEIKSFAEKTTVSSTKYSSAGIYCFNRPIFDLMPEKKAFSIETDFFPKLVGKDFYGYKAESQFIDIGTPERFKKANEFLKKGR